MFIVYINGKPISKHSTKEIAEKKVISYMKKSNTFRKHERLSVVAILSKSSVYRIEYIEKGTNEFTEASKAITKYLEQFKR